MLIIKHYIRISLIEKPLAVVAKCFSTAMLNPAHASAVSCCQSHAKHECLGHMFYKLYAYAFMSLGAIQQGGVRSMTKAFWPGSQAPHLSMLIYPLLQLLNGKSNGGNSLSWNHGRPAPVSRRTACRKSMLLRNEYQDSPARIAHPEIAVKRPMIVK